MRLTAIATAILVASLGSGVAAQQKDPRKLVGQDTTVCGTVKTFTYQGDDCTVQLDMAQPYWKPLFYALIPVEQRATFPLAPEYQYLGQQICVSGTVVRDKKRVPHIVVKAPSQIQQTTASASRPPFRDGVPRTCDKGIVGPKLLKEVRPTYPSLDLFRKRLEGIVLLEAAVEVDGSVTDMAVVFAEVPEFNGAAEKALKEWKFQPATRDGVPTPVVVQVEMSFTLGLAVIKSP